MGGSPTSHTPAHDTDATVAPFRAWRGLRPLVARGPAGPPQQSAALSIITAKWQQPDMTLLPTPTSDLPNFAYKRERIYTQMWVTTAF